MFLLFFKTFIRVLVGVRERERERERERRVGWGVIGGIESGVCSECVSGFLHVCCKLLVLVVDG